MEPYRNFFLEAKGAVLRTASTALAAFANESSSETFSRILKPLGNLSWLEVFIELFLLYAFCRVVYRLYFHPLAKFPGPKLAAISPIYGQYMLSSGYVHLYTERLHRKYGSVVRLSPNELSFSSATAYKTIHDQKQRFIKAPIYVATGLNSKPSSISIVSERDPVLHAHKKKRVQNAFSFRALSEQEDMVAHWVDMLIEKLGQHGEKGEKPLDVVRWCNMTAFDVIGDLAFGESFGSLRDGKQHFWVDTIFRSVKLSTYFRGLHDYPWFEFFVKRIAPFAMPQKLVQARLKHHQYAHDKLEKRMNTETSRKDFMSYLLANKDDPALKDMQYLVTEASILVVAGSDTTAAFLSSATWLLCKNPNSYRKLVSEIRGSFTSYDQIKHEAAQHLPYLNAVIEEGLRYFPPVSSPLPRLCPGATIDGFYVPAGTIVFVSPRCMTRSERYWKRANEFCPERWLPKNHPHYSSEFNNDNREASQPFSTGSRACIGRNLAYMEMRLVLSKIFWTYDVKLMDREEDQRWLEDWNRKMFGMWERGEYYAKFIPVVR